MDAELRHLDGACAGQTRIVTQDFATIGRHPSADVRFDAERDLDVSGRHAALFRQGGGWMLRDLGSSNGTWLNGERIKGDRLLAPNDVIRFGATGPRLVFAPAQGATIPPTRKEPAPPAAASQRILIPEGSTTQRIQVAAERRAAPWRRATLTLAVLTVIGVVAAAWLLGRKGRALAAERDALLGRTDSLLEQLASASTSVTALEQALRDAQQETRQLRAAIAAREKLSVPRLDSLSRRLAQTTRRQEVMLRAARLDAAAIARGNRDAVGMLLSEFPDGHRVAGTGFAVRVRGDTGWIVTSRHLVLAANGDRAARLGIIFNGSNQNFRGVLLKLADSADLALVSVRIRGGMPVVHGLGAPGQVGDPVVLLGFPYGFDFPGGSEWRRTGVSVSSFTGSLRALRDEAIEVDAYGAGGSSGSPVFNAAGDVIGVVYGGDPRTGGRIVFAVPVKAVKELLGDR
ncbi:MAG TPA: FHA domain-containing protein [Gemmatimonadales bacterium]|nr:FHA domain-containing protein [Gemmatimonadales bacterium]